MKYRLYLPLITFICLLSLSLEASIRLSSSEKKSFPYIVSFDKAIDDHKHQKLKLKISKIYGTVRTLKSGEKYILIGAIKSDNPDDLSIYFGNTAKDGGGASKIGEISQGARPTSDDYEFKVGMKIEKNGQAHLSVYSQEIGKTNTSNCIYKIKLNNKAFILGSAIRSMNYGNS